MAFDKTKPDDNTLISELSTVIPANFAAQDTDYGTDHYAFSAGSHNGYHKKVTLFDAGAAPAAVASTAIEHGDVSAISNASGAVAPSVLPYCVEPGGYNYSMLGIGAWAYYNGTADTLYSSANIASVVRTATGRYTFTFTRAFLNNQIAVFVNQSGGRSMFVVTSPEAASPCTYVKIETKSSLTIYQNSSFSLLVLGPMVTT